jgi:hypothetical protein
MGGFTRDQRSGFLCSGYPGNALQVIGELNLLPSAEQVFDAFRDSPTNLDDQPAAGLQSGMRLRNQAFDYFQPCGPCENSVSRLEFADFELHLIFFGFTDVRWVRHHEIECGEIERVKQIGLVKTNTVFELMAGGIDMG